jgi:hypothetical protein
MKRVREKRIQDDLKKYLAARGWLVERMIGNAWQIGIPDLFVHHPKWGSRWIDVKCPDHRTFTRAQKQKWPQWERFGLGIWILTAADQSAYDKLFQPPNWREYWRPSWGELPGIDAMLAQLALPISAAA